MFLIAKIKNEGWKWRDNYMREHARRAIALLGAR